MTWAITYTDGDGNLWEWRQGRSFVTCNGEDTINIWDIPTGQPRIAPTVEALTATVAGWVEAENQ
jgi:hypothetical protein